MAQPNPVKPEVVVTDALPETACEYFLQVVNHALDGRDVVNVALSGGSTPQALYELLASPQRRQLTDWSRIRLFMGDERYVPYDHDWSNFGMAKRTLIDRVAVTDANVFPIPTDLPTADECALAYERSLRDQLTEDGSFDLILLGLGEDGHTASLFPHHASLFSEDRWVVTSPPGTLSPPVDRITLTLAAINRAHNVTFLVSGAKKALALSKILGGYVSVEDMPAAGVRPTHGRITWLVDHAAVHGTNL